jgi:hypothetical protein
MSKMPDAHHTPRSRVALRLRQLLHRLYRGLELLPLAAFLAAIGVFDSYASGRWILPYAIGTAVAAVVTVAALWRGQILNRIALGINGYLLSGLLSQLLSLEWLTRALGELEAAGMLIWIVGVGAASTLASRAGFAGVANDDRDKVNGYSLWLLAASVLALTACYFLHGNRLLSDVLPFAFLFAVHGLVRRLQAAGPAGDRAQGTALP